MWPLTHSSPDAPAATAVQGAESQGAGEPQRSGPQEGAEQRPGPTAPHQACTATVQMREEWWNVLEGMSP